MRELKGECGNRPANNRGLAPGVRAALVMIIAATMPLTLAACAASPEQEKEVNAAAACHLAAKKAALSESSVERVGPWTFNDMGETGWIVQKFDSQNVFGATVTAEYNCEFNYATEQVVAFSIEYDS